MQENVASRVRQLKLRADRRPPALPPRLPERHRPGPARSSARAASDTCRPLPCRRFEAVRPGWFDTPMRWAQLTLVENDPGQFDPQFWLDYFRRIKADAACLSAGGIVAYYPTEVPLHHRSSMPGRDAIRSGRWSPAAGR